MPRSNLDNRTTQTSRIVNLLRSRSPEWVPLPEILNLRISQYSARIHQARHKWGLPVENRTEIVNGEKHSWFRLVEAPAAESRTVPKTSAGGPCSRPVFLA